VKEWR